MKFTFTEKSTLTLGQYPFNAPRQQMTNNKNLNESTLIYFYHMTFSADISLSNYQEALKLSTGDTDIPEFSMFFGNNRNAPALQDPIVCQDYFAKQKFRLTLEPKQTPNRLNAFFRGTLQQHAGLAGVGEINLTFTYYAQQITDDKYIAEFKKGYLKSQNGGY